MRIVQCYRTPVIEDSKRGSKLAFPYEWNKWRLGLSHTRKAWHAFEPIKISIPQNCHHTQKYSDRSLTQDYLTLIWEHTLKTGTRLEDISSIPIQILSINKTKGPAKQNCWGERRQLLCSQICPPSHLRGLVSEKHWSVLIKGSPFIFSKKIPYVRLFLYALIMLLSGK